MRRLAVILGLTLLAITVTSCSQNNSDINIQDKLSDIRQKLESDLYEPPAGSSQTRDFTPYPKGVTRAVSYGCYREGQAPGQKGPSEVEVLEDLRIIEKHWNLIRVYNADADTELILETIRKHRIPLKVMLGIWLENEENNPQAKKSNIANILRGIELSGAYPHQVVAVNVGNETQVFWSGHRLKTQRLIKYLRIVRAYTTVPVTTADDYNFWNKEESKKVADELDFIVTHIYPLWNGKTLENAIEWLDKSFADVQQVHPHKTVVLGEIGWATDYNPEKKGDGEQGALVKGEVSLKAQERFLLELDEWIEKNEVTCFWFEVFDESWKGGGEKTGLNEIEKNWGVYYATRSPKLSFSNYLINK